MATVAEIVIGPPMVPAEGAVNAVTTRSGNDDTVKVAVTLLAALILTTQLPVPVQAPLQPVKVEPVVGVAVRVTLVPLA